MQRHIKLIIVAVVAIVTLGLMLLDNTHFSPGDTAPAVVTQYGPAGAPAPDVTFTLLDGGALPLHSLKGHTVLLHFWASWCAPCREEFRSLLKRIAEGDKDTILLAVSGDAKAEDARTFLAPYMRDFKTLFDAGRVRIAIDTNRSLIEGAFQTFQYPETILIDPDQIMRQKIVGVYK